MQEITDPRSPVLLRGQSRQPILNALTSARFFAAMHVALYHMVRPHTLWGPLAPVFSVGYVGVSFFFLLSGFILTYSHAAEYESGKGDPIRFWVARFARIYPVYLVTLLFAAYVGAKYFSNKLHIVAYIADLLMLQTWSVRMAPFFHVTAWSLSVEAFFYLVFPFLILRLAPSSGRRAWLSFAGMWLLAIAVPLASLHFFPVAGWQEGASDAGKNGVFLYWLRRFPPLLLPQFMGGIFLGWIFLRFRPSRRVAMLFAVVGIMILAAALFLSGHLPFEVLHNGLLMPCFALIILGLSETNWISRLLSVPFLVLLGEASYSLYLVHFLFNDWVKGFGAGTTLLDAVWKLAIVIPLSIGLHLLVERPCRRVILQWWKRRQEIRLAVA